MPHSQNTQWKILVALTDQLKIPDGKYKDAVEKYENVGKWLQKSDSAIFADSFVYPQGSVRLGTTVKPYSDDEYDIDLVVHLPYINESISSEVIKNVIGDRLKENETYRHKLEELKRGWRINYAGDFYLDITPAIPDKNCNNLCPINKHYAEHVPDSKLQSWKPSNPRGYAEWFDDIDKKMPRFTTDSRSFLALEARNVEAVPKQDEFKGVLRRSVQLLKRHRDVFFNETHSSFKNWMPISILITTLAARAYNDLVKEQRQYTAIELIKLIIKNMNNYIENIDGNTYVGNPTNLKENFAEKWKDAPLYKITFDMWVETVYQDIEKILSAKGIDNIGKVINNSFGGHYGNKVIESFNKDVEENRNIGALSGIFNLNSDATVVKNTFYGR